jgi:hypothetical protein
MVKGHVSKAEEFLDLIVGLITPEFSSSGIEGLHYFLDDILNYYATDEVRRVYQHKLFVQFLAMAKAEVDKTSDKFKVKNLFFGKICVVF